MKRTIANVATCSAALSALLYGCTSPAPSGQVTVTNPTGRERVEVVSVPVDTATLSGVREHRLMAVDAAGNVVTTQVTSAGELLLDARVPANGSATYTFAQRNYEDPTFSAFGQVYPERVDDVAWENDRMAFRAYGPALQASGEQAYGYDVWVKSVERMVVPERYFNELNQATRAALDSLAQCNPDSAEALRRATSYHYDHGNGLDCYKVGPTLGGGANALVVADTLLYPYCYATCEVLDNGPLRFTARLTYRPFMLDGTELTEVRLLSLDAHSQLNRTEVEYRGQVAKRTVAAGPVVHDPDGGTYQVDAQQGFVAYADPTDRPNDGFGTIYVGAVFPNGLQEAKLSLFGADEAAKRGANGHVLGIAELDPGATFTYYWGGAWSKWGFDSFEAWTNYLKEFADNQRNPLIVK